MATYGAAALRSRNSRCRPCRDAFKKRRCLVVANGYIEWKRNGKEKPPYLIRRKEGGPFAFADLWSVWKLPDGDITSYTIITSEPNEMMAEIHNRMPVILAEDDHLRWLDNGVADVLKPCPSDWLEAYPADKRVGNVKINDAALIEPI